MSASTFLPGLPLHNDQLESLVQGLSRDNRRAQTRHTFFSPVTFRTDDYPTRLQTGFSRDLSAGGIGMIHGMPIEAGTQAVITIVTPEAHLAKSAEAVWCRPAGDGWYLSGWRFTTAS